MKVLFVGSPPAPEAGGAHGFLTTVRDALQNAKHAHQYVFDDKLRPNVDFTWFLSPSPAFAQCMTPFAFTVWDIAHRVHPYFPEVSLSGWKWQSRQDRYSQAVPRAAIVVTGTQEGAKQLDHFFHVEKRNVLINPLPVNPALIGATPEPVKGLEFAKFLLYPAQFWPHKNHVTVLDALKLLPEEYKVVFTGSDKGNLNYVKDYARKLEVYSRCVFPGFVSTGQLNWLYRNAFACVYASTMGPDNLPPVEAMALGCPVVCASYDGAYDQMKHAALYFDPYDPGDLADKVHRLEDDDFRRSMISLGASTAGVRTAAQYADRIAVALDNFAKIRKLWGQGYVHL